MKSSTENLMLVETYSQVNDFIHRYGENYGHWIALGPSAMHCLNKKGLQYTIPEDYCSLSEIETVCVEGFEKLKLISNKIDELIIEKDLFLKECGIRPFEFYLWQIGAIHDAVVSRAVWLKKILGRFPKAKVYIHVAPPDKKWYTSWLGFGKEETLWGRLVELRDLKNEVIVVSDPSMNKDDKSNKLSLKYIPKTINKFFNSMILFKFVLMSVLYSFHYKIAMNGINILLFFNRKKRKNILIIGSPYEWLSLFSPLIQSGMNIYFCPHFATNKTYNSSKVNSWSEGTEALWKIFYDEMKKDEMGKMWGIDYIQLLKERICWIIENSTVIANHIITEMQKLLQKYFFSCVCTSASIVYADLVIKEFFRRNNIPVISWQHGSVWYENRITQRVDLLNMRCTSLLLTYGESAKMAFESSDLKKSCVIENVGSNMLDNIGQCGGLAAAKKYRIIYVITSYYKNSWYCAFSSLYSDRLYFLEQLTIINRLCDIVQRIDTVFVTIKLYPCAAIMDDDPPWVAELSNKQGFRLVRHPGFVQQMKEQDIVIIDTPTTTLLQSLATKLPVFVLTSVVTPPSKDQLLLRKRAICADSGNKLMKELEDYIVKGIYNADIDNRDFLKLYGTYLDDGQSIIRVLKIMKRINEN